MILASPISPSTLVGAGLAVVFVIMFAETGLLVGFFLPGDTLLLYAGYHTVGSHAAPHLHYLSVTLVAVAGAIVGAQTGYVLGRVAGDRLFTDPARQKYVERTHKVLHRFGEGKSVVVARFIPAVRTFMNPALGITKMSARDFTVWNVVGAVLWVPVVVALGRLLPKNFPIDEIILAVVVISLSVPVVEAIRRRRSAPAA